MTISNSTAHQSAEPLRVLAIDVGAGTQDILIYDERRAMENCEKLVLPSQTQVVARRIAAVTAAGRPLHLSGRLMGGGASSDAVARHIAAGLPVTATPDAARTIHNRPERIAAFGVDIRERPPSGACEVTLGDIDLPALSAALAHFNVEIPSTIAVAVQDHGYRPGAGNNEVRFDYLQSLLDDGGLLDRMVFSVPPAGMTRMEAIAEAVPGVFLMDTGAAAVLGVRGDPIAREHIDRHGAVIVNLGNMHTFAALVKGNRLYGLFEHHSHGMSADLLGELVGALRSGELNVSGFTERFDGHGAAFSEDYVDEGPFTFVVVTGPNRAIARPLGYYEAAPYGDMMLSGAFGLVEAVRRAREHQ
jgi:uncharacterized protein (DUF1786 family)